MSVLFYLASGFVLLLVKTSLLLPVPAVARTFHPLLILTVYLGLFRSGIQFAALSMVFGYLLDIFSGSKFGFHLIITTAIYYLTHLLRGRFFLESAFFQGVYLAAMVFAHDLLGSAVLSLIGGTTGASFLFDGLIARMALNGLVGVWIFKFVRRIDAAWLPLSERKSPALHLD